MNNKVALITGASSGFGRLLVTAFLRNGWIVIGSMRNAAQRADLFADELHSASDRLHLLSLDVANEGERTAAAEFIASKFGGRLDCLINNAGYGVFGALEDVSEEQLRALMEVNFFGLVLLSRQLLPCLRAAHGRVINISSVLGYMGMPLSSLYCASKYAVEGISEALRYELQPHGVQVALVEPGAFRTSFGSNQQWAENSADESSPYFTQSQAFRRFRERRATGPGNPPDPVIAAILRLAATTNMPLRVRCGRDAGFAWALKRLLPEQLFTGLMSAVFNRMVRQ